MKRDLATMRKIALFTEEQNGSFASFDIQFDGVDSGEVAYNLRMMIKGGLIDGKETSPGDRLHSPEYDIDGLTWEGHEFLDSVRTDSLFHMLLDKIKPLGGTVSMETLKHLSKLLAANLSGLGD